MHQVIRDSCRTHKAPTSADAWLPALTMKECCRYQTFPITQGPCACVLGAG